MTAGTTGSLEPAPANPSLAWTWSMACIGRPEDEREDEMSVRALESVVEL